MRKYWLLTRLMLRNMFASMNPFHSVYTDGKLNRKAVGRTVGVVLLAVFGLVSVLMMEYGIYTGLDGMGQPILLPGMALLVSMLLTLIMGLFHGLSDLFQGKDAPFLAVLPMDSRQVFAARFTTLCISEFLLNAVICIPAVVFYILGTHQTFPMALTALPVVLLTPLIPMSIVLLISCLLMRVSYFSSHREIIVNVLSVAVALCYSLFITRMNNSGNSSPQELAAALSRENGVLNLLLSRFPPVQWAMDGMLGDWAKLALFAGVSLVMPLLVILICGPSYLSQALSAGEKTVHKRTKGSVSWRTSSPLAALHALEWKEILRTPAWATNSLLGLIMFPLMFGVGLVSGMSANGGVGRLHELLTAVDPAYVVLVAAACVAMGSMVNPAVSTAISREGGRWPTALTLPVAQKTRFLAKFLVGLEINLACSLLLLIVVAVITRLSPVWLLATLAIDVLLAVAGAASGLWIDAQHPQLTWSNETEAIKKNYNQVFGMLIWFLLIGLCAIPAILLWSRPRLALALVALVALMAAAVFVLLLSKSAKKHMTLPE